MKKFYFIINFVISILAICVTISPLPSLADTSSSDSDNSLELRKDKESIAELGSERDKLSKEGDAAFKRKDYAEAVRYYRAAAAQGSPESQTALGICYYFGRGVEKNLLEFFNWSRKAAQQDFAPAQRNLGICYYEGYGVEKSLTQAIDWFQKAAEQGDSEAQRNLGIFYYDGNGVQKDLAKAISLFQKAAEKGDAVAQYHLGRCYHYGNGVPKDQANAISWLQKSAEQDYPKAQYLLGYCYEHGEGTEKNLAEAYNWYKKSAEQGFIHAQARVGIFYCSGLGVTSNLEEGKKWLQRVAVNENIQNREMVTAAKNILTEFKKFETLEKRLNRQLQRYRNIQPNTADNDHQNQITVLTEAIASLQNGIKFLPLLIINAHNGDSEAQTSLRNLKENAESVYKLLDQQLAYETNEILVPIDIYTQTKQYDNLKPYDAFTRGKQACGNGDPQGYALLESSARRGCNQAKIVLAQALLPVDYKQNTGIGSWYSFLFEGKELNDADRAERYIKWMSSAADNGSLSACQELRQVYKEGTLVSKDSAKVFKYTKAAAQLKDPEAMFDLGERYAKGIGCPKDRQASVKWMKQAAHAGNDDAKQWIADRRGHYINGTETYKISSSQALQEAYKQYPNDWTVSEWNGSQNGSVIGILKDVYNITPPPGTFGSRGRYIITDGYRDLIIPYETSDNIGDIVRGNPYSGCVLIDDRTRTRTVRKWQGPKIGGWEDLLK
ncbi:MAG: tetratricopeptide repeat protein [bacterium]|nr:tetratricopeptide repeat protein [bacterium]